MDVLLAAVEAVHVSEGGGEEVDAGVDELERLFGGGEQALEIARVLHAVLAAIDAARFRLRGDAALVAVRDQLARALQVLFLLVVRHVDHDGVEGEVAGAVDRLGVLRVVEVERHGHRGGLAGVRGEVDEEAVRVGHGPWEEEDLERGALAFGRADAGDYRFEVVGNHAGDAIAALFGGFEDLEAFVVGEFGW